MNSIKMDPTPQRPTGRPTGAASATSGKAPGGCVPQRPDLDLKPPADREEIIEGLKDTIEFLKADKDGDSSLSLEEFKGTMNPLVAAVRPGEVIDKFGEYDTNDDGKVSRDEFQAGRKADRDENPFRPIDVDKPVIKLPIDKPQLPTF